MRYLILLIFIFTAIFGRENPFEPAVKKTTTSVIEHVTNSKIYKNPHKNRSKNIPLFKWLSIEMGNDYIFIKTKDKLLKSFRVHHPEKIVLDFTSKKTFNTKRLKIKSRYISKIAVGAHKKYYRVALKLKRKTKFSLKYEKDGYRLTFK